MPNSQKTCLTTLSILFLTAIGATPLYAQDAMSDDVDSGLEANYIFMDTDINKDGSLDREEFVAFAATKAQKGDEHYRALVVSGDYDNQFNTLDYNADGVLSLEEIKRPDMVDITEEDGLQNEDAPVPEDEG